MRGLIRALTSSGGNPAWTRRRASRGTRAVCGPVVRYALVRHARASSEATATAPAALARVAGPARPLRPGGRRGWHLESAAAAQVHRRPESANRSVGHRPEVADHAEDQAFPREGALPAGRGADWCSRSVAPHGEAAWHRAAGDVRERRWYWRQP